MTEDTFRYQLERMRTRWPKAFDAEFSKLVASEMAQLSDESFVRAVNHLIGSRSPSQPPLIQDFRAIRSDAERRAFDAMVHGAAHALNTPWPKGSLERALSANPDWAGCKTASEAIEVERLKIQIERAK